jgi:hypothetical protein
MGRFLIIFTVSLQSNLKLDYPFLNLASKLVANYMQFVFFVAGHVLSHRKSLLSPFIVECGKTFWHISPVGQVHR